MTGFPIESAQTTVARESAETVCLDSADTESFDPADAAVRSRSASGRQPSSESAPPALHASERCFEILAVLNAVFASEPDGK